MKLSIHVIPTCILVIATGMMLAPRLRSASPRDIHPILESEFIGQRISTEFVGLRFLLVAPLCDSCTKSNRVLEAQVPTILNKELRIISENRVIPNRWRSNKELWILDERHEKLSFEFYARAPLLLTLDRNCKITDARFMLPSDWSSMKS